jgi:hypothetical protein
MADSLFVGLPVSEMTEGFPQPFVLLSNRCPINIG